MGNHMKLTDNQFESRFEACDLSATDFTHEAHIRLAWIHITRYGLHAAERTIQDQLKSFVASVGAEDKYHTTMTVAAIKAVSHFVNKSQSDTFSAFIVEFPQLKSEFKRLMNQHYSYDLFGSSEAKNSFVKPDLLPFN